MLERNGRRGNGRRWGAVRGGGEQGVILTVVVFVNKGEEPVTAFFWVAPTFKDDVACLVVGPNMEFGEGDAEARVAELGNAKQGSGEFWHDVALAGG